MQNNIPQKESHRNRRKVKPNIFFMNKIFFKWTKRHVKMVKYRKGKHTFETEISGKSNKVHQRFRNKEN